ncbi:hypothetical protein [Clostridium saccharobutylicum]|nr:hypothetical protein [Clostridium saccharobutylicum]MBC2411370.1 hypothetical protein [Clostridium saccharobutylicum]MBC2447513.1 hypothetical protein [Clostridium saccharobutylicum]MBC2501280.1 hypothetical protein [Clostridium saccharobutylicum]MBC2510157.1 hypothetical protein [Clostridium saccharobutylicum]MBC2513125.1 hypothetical protein [Clostridium saccharobutylicum]
MVTNLKKWCCVVSVTGEKNCRFLNVTLNKRAPFLSSLDTINSKWGEASI